MGLLRTIDKKKMAAFIVAFLAFDFVIVVAVSKIFLHEETEAPMDITIPETFMEQAQQAEFTEEDAAEAIYDIYGILLVGDFNLGNNIEFHFSSDGSYSGFFDNDNRYVEGYTYQLENDAGQTLVHIYNEDKSRIVTYIMTLSEDTGNILLELPGTEDQLELKY